MLQHKYRNILFDLIASYFVLIDIKNKVYSIFTSVHPMQEDLS